jgi:hypothetical protein
MKANPDKFQAIAIGNKSHSEHISFNLKGNIIKCEDEVKLLGITIDFQLKFNTHIANTCKKASRQLNVLKRVGKYLNRPGKLTIYHPFILSSYLAFLQRTEHKKDGKDTGKSSKIYIPV